MCLLQCQISVFFGHSMRSMAKLDVLLPKNVLYQPLLQVKCLRILLYGTEACPLLSRDRRSFEFNINRLFMKIFRTGSPAVVRECQKNFNFSPIESQLKIRTKNTLCLLFKQLAVMQLDGIFGKYKPNVIRSASQLAHTLRCKYQANLQHFVYSLHHVPMFLCLIFSCVCLFGFSIIATSFLVNEGEYIKTTRHSSCTKSTRWLHYVECCVQAGV